MIRIIQKIILSLAIVLMMGTGVQAAIFGGTVETDVPGSVGYCLRNPKAIPCVDAEYGTVCDNPEFYNDLRCVSEAAQGSQLTKDALTGSGITHTETVGELIVKYVNFILPYLTLAAFVGFVVAGFLYVTAYGNDEQLQKAKKILMWSVVGLILVIMSFTIVQFLTSSLVKSLR
ncbi:hypothetical protein JW758_06075 [Candidatus Peregrinibacteria bacterium]|nr:hypothetical protein [Candidatus Peregrinibacteria bacterium]